MAAYVLQGSVFTAGYGTVCILDTVRYWKLRHVLYVLQGVVLHNTVLTLLMKAGGLHSGPVGASPMLIGIIH
jgi:hypothetical protein